MAVSTNAEVSESQAPPKQVTKNAIIYFIGQLLSWIATFCAVSIIPDKIGVVAQGQIALVTSRVLLFAPLIAFGVDIYLIKEIGKDRNRAEELVRSTLGLRIFLFPFLILLSLLSLSLTKEQNPLIWKMGYLGIMFVCSAFFSDILRATLSGWEQAQKVSLTELVFSVSPLIAIPFLRFGNPLPLSLTAFLGVLFVLIMRWYWVSRQFALKPIFNFEIWKELLRGGMPFVANNMLLQLLMAIAVFMLEHLDGVEAIGIYWQAVKLFGAFLFIPTALGMALLPSLSRLGEADKKEMGEIQERVMLLLIVTGLPIVTLVMLLTESLSKILYKDQTYQAVNLVLQVYALAIIPMYLVSALYQFLVAQNRGGIWTRFLVISVGVYSISAWFLIPFTRDHYHNGAIGAVGATVISETCSAIFAFWILGNNPFHRETIFRILRAIVATFCMTVVIWFTRKMFILIPTILGCSVFAFLAWKLRVLGEEEQNKLAHLINSKLRRR